MKYKNVFLLALSVALSFMFLQTAEPLEFQVAESVLVSEVVQGITGNIQDVIESLEGATGNTLFRTRQQLELLITQLRMVAEGSTESFFNKLGNAERQFFNDVQTKLDTLKNLQRVTATDVEHLVSHASHAIRGLPLAKTYPVVLGYGPLFVASGGPLNEDNVRVNISGVLLASHEPKLIVRNNICQRTGKIDSQLVFSCDKNLFVTADVIGTANGKLFVYERLGFFSWLLGVDPREYHFDISINIIPTVLGEVTTYVTTQSRTMTRGHRTQRFSHRNGHCSGTRQKLFSFNAREGWKIDPATIRPTCRQSSRSTCQGLRNVTEYSFGYACTVQNSGTCGPFWRDGRGSCWGSIGWEEVRAVDTVDDRTLESVELRWGMDVMISLPEKVSGVRIAVDKADGTRRIVTANDASDPWFDVEVNLQERYVVIRPASLEEAMRKV